jgi:hypothetical protein
MTREEKILALTRHELMFVIEMPEELEDSVAFFARGGFHAFTDEQLNRKYDLFVAEEREEV